MVTVTIHVPVVQRLLWMSARRTTAQGVDVSSDTVRDTSNLSSIVPSVSACLVPIPSSSMTDLACPATNTPLSSPRYDIFSFAMRPAVEMSSTHLPAFS